MIDQLIPVDCRGNLPEHLFGLHADKLPPEIVGWMKGLSPYYQRDGITILRGDCQKLLPLFPTYFFDLLVSDPPYGIDYDTNLKGNHGSKRNRYKPVRGDNAPGGFDPSHLLGFKRICLWGGNYYAHRLPRSNKWIVWDKRRGKGQNCGSDCELAWTKGLKGVSTRAFYHMWNGACRESERSEPRRHPTQKPVALMKWCMELFPGTRTILDPYMGVGTTLVAARQLGLQAVGIEWDEKYCRTAVERLEALNAVPGPRRRASTQRPAISVHDRARRPT
jgi:DNA modification methylase